MKRVFLCIMLLLAPFGQALCQNIIIGDRLSSDVRSRRWLMDMQPEAADFSCVLFYHSESEACQAALSHIKTILEECEQPVNLVIITKERHEDVGATLTQHLDDNVGVAFDEGGRIFRQMGVSFIPFCVVCDKKRYAHWCGNGAMLTTDIMDKILTTK